ncbi:MAG: TRAP transporter small permease [Deltaproteobacteria bacterium]|nr:TRAP transporter small permease [Deltaproteobacteria bacterium]MBW1996167.1 TRAP transporter small permease [Deltaproteobacteria bacterium]MBW2152487.1 TRAP transporter small permease [Deltaproteobacteria bacterium]
MMQTSIKHYFERIGAILNRIEDGILISLLMAMTIVAVVQIILRNLFEAGIIWADPLLRMSVLWVGLIGAMVASRFDNHIRIDLVGRMLPKPLASVAKCMVGCFTAVCCGIFAYYSYRFVLLEFKGGGVAFGDVPVWFCASITPVAFVVIALRSFVSALSQFTSSKTTSS